MEEHIEGRKFARGWIEDVESLNFTWNYWFYPGESRKGSGGGRRDEEGDFLRPASSGRPPAGQSFGLISQWRAFPINYFPSSLVCRIPSLIISASGCFSRSFPVPQPPPAMILTRQSERARSLRFLSGREGPVRAWAGIRRRKILRRGLHIAQGGCVSSPFQPLHSFPGPIPHNKRLCWTPWQFPTYSLLLLILRVSLYTMYFTILYACISKRFRPPACYGRD